MVKGMPLTQNMIQFVWGPGTCWQRILYPTVFQYKAGQGAVSLATHIMGFDMASQRSADPNIVYLDGRMQLAITVTFCAFEQWQLSNC